MREVKRVGGDDPTIDINSVWNQTIADTSALKPHWDLVLDISPSDIETIEIPAESILSGSATFEHAITDVGEFNFGSVQSEKFEIQAVGGSLSRTDIVNIYEHLSAGIDVGARVFFSVPDGIIPEESATTDIVVTFGGFISIDPVVSEGRNIRIEAYDRMSEKGFNAETDMVYASTHTTPRHIVDNYVSKIIPGETIGTFPNEDQILTDVTFDAGSHKGMSSRNILSDVAAVCGCFAKTTGDWSEISLQPFDFNYSGVYNFGFFDPWESDDYADYDGGTFWSASDSIGGETFDYLVNVTKILEAPSIDFAPVTITGVYVETRDGEEYATAGTDGYYLTIKNNACVTSQEVAQQVADNIYAMYGGKKFTPFSASISADPRLEAGDAVQFEVDGLAVETIVTSFHYVCGGISTISCEADRWKNRTVKMIRGE